MAAADSKNGELMKKLDKLENLILEEQIAFEQRIGSFSIPIASRPTAFLTRQNTDPDVEQEEDPDKSFKRLSAMLEQSILVGQNALSVARPDNESLEDNRYSSTGTPTLWAELQGQSNVTHDPPAYEESKPISDDAGTALEALIDQFTTSHATHLTRFSLVASFLVLCLSIFIASRHETMSDLTCHCVCPIT